MSNFLIIIILIGIGYVLYLHTQRLKNIEFYNEFMDSIKEMDLPIKECVNALKEVSSKLDNFKEVMDKKLDTIESKLKNPAK